MSSSRIRFHHSLIIAGILSCCVRLETIDAQSAPQTPMWNQFRGPNGSGVSVDADPPVKFDKNTNLLWSKRILPGASSPCIWENRIFLSTYDAEAKKLEIVCHDRNDGKVLWRVDIKASEIESVHASASPASGTIATDGERIYAYFGSRGLLCYDLNGKPVWAIAMPLPGLVNGSGASPIVTGDLVLLSREETGSPHLLAVNKRTGAKVWNHAYLFPPGKYARNSATPIIWKDQVILHTNGGIHAIALSDGKPIWWGNTTTNGISTPVIHGNKLFVTTWQPLGEPANRGKIPTFAQLRKHDADRSGTIARKEFPRGYTLFHRPLSTVKGDGKFFPLQMAFRWIDQDEDGEISEEEWKGFEQSFTAKLDDHGLLSIDLGGKGDITKTHVRVIEKRNIPEVPSALAHQGRIYLVKDGGIVNCLDARSGKKLFRARLAATGSYFASPIAVNDTIYLTSIAGTITVLEVGDEYRVISRNDLSERIAATPAIAGDTLYVRTNQHLFAFKNVDSK